MILTPEKDHGKFVCDDKNPKLNITEKERGDLSLILKSVNINLLQFNKSDNPNDVLLHYTLKSVGKNIPETIQLSKYGDQFKLVNDKLVLNTSKIEEFTIPVGSFFFDLEVKSMTNQPFNLEMFFETEIK